MNDVARAYVGAMIDAEGVVTISAKKSQSPRGRINYGRLVLVTNSSWGLILFLRDITGLGITYHNKKPAKPNWSPIHRWQVVGQKARTLLEEVEPYLVLKRELARILIDWPLQSKGGRRPEDAAIFEQQIALCGRVRELNRRGLKAESFSDGFPLDHPARVH